MGDCSILEPVLSELNFRVLLDSIEAKADGTLSGIQLQLRPKAWLKYLYHEGKWDRESHCILDGVTNGFHRFNKNQQI